MTGENICQVLPLEQVPVIPGWLEEQSCPVIAVGEEAVGKGVTDNADVLVSTEEEAQQLIDNVGQNPQAALVLVQVLRAVDLLPLQQAITVESLGYGLLQSGGEFRRWLAARDEEPALVSGGDGDPILLERQDNTVFARLNRPENRNSLTVEMRDALVELFELVAIDTSIESLQLSANGACFSVGGELREFGLSVDPVNAHYIRSVHNPGRLLASISDRTRVQVHSACIGSGIEIPAFAASIAAHSKSYFQLPELQFGLIPGAGGCVSITRRIGRQRTAWMALSGKKVNAQTALEWGLIDEISD